MKHKDNKDNKIIKNGGLPKDVDMQTVAVRSREEPSEQRENSSAIYLTSGYLFDDAEHARALFAREVAGNNYGRYHNPNTKELATKIALLESAEDAICFATGMAAIFQSIMGLCKQGDHIVAGRCLFGSTVQILTKMLPSWGMSSEFVAVQADLATWEKALSKKNTRMCIVETPTNPTVEIIDIEALAKICTKHNVILMVDNTYATPFLMKPLELGADLVMHSATKYIDGGGRCLGGIITGSKELIAPLEFMLRHAGAALSPFNAWVLSKSLEHLQLRIIRHSENALELAKFLESQPQVKQVNYPYLPSSPFYEVAQRIMKGGAGGTMSFVLNTDDAKDHSANNKDRPAVSAKSSQAMSFINSLKLCSLSANLGDSRSIVTHPTTTTHSSLSAEERKAMNIDDALVRVSVGLEAVEDIIADFQQAFDVTNVNHNYKVAAKASSG